MDKNLAFSYRGCNTCVRLARKILRQRKIISWGELESQVFIEQVDHPPRVHTMLLYPSLLDVPLTDDWELTGALIIQMPSIFYPIQSTISAQVHMDSPMSLRWLKSYIEECYEGCSLRFEMELQKNGLLGRLELEGMELNVLPTILV